MDSTAAKRVIAKFGGITACAAALKYPKSTVQRWSDSGRIHPKHNPLILNAAIKLSVRLDVADFVDVDLGHPAFNAPSGQSAGDTSPRADGASPYPNPEIHGSPAGDAGVGADAANASAVRAATGA